MTQPYKLLLSESLTKQIVKMLQDDKGNEYKHNNYQAAVDHADEMSWHVYGNKPVRLLERIRPREDEAVRKYRLESYEPITKGYCKKGLKILSKIFSPNLYSIRPKESSEGKKLVNYALNEYPGFNSVVNYVSQFLLKKTIADPNAVIIVQPSNYLVADKEYITPIATCYPSNKVHIIDREIAFLFDKVVQENNKRYWLYTYVDKVVVAKLILELNSNNNLLVTVTDQYYHGLEDDRPLWYLGGEIAEVDDLLFESLFNDAVPYWNKAIGDDSDVDGAYRMHLYPQKWEVADECEYVERYEGGSFPCTNGYVYNGEKKLKCPVCKGSGYKTSTSPYETHLVNRDKFLNPEGSANIQVPFGYVTVPTDATKMLEERVDRNLRAGLKALNMDVVDEIGLNQSGKAKEMDRTELNQFMQKVADLFFDVHVTNIFYYFAKYMFISSEPNKVMPDIVKPTQFDIYTTSELTDSLKKAKDSELHPTYIRSKQMEIQNKEFQTNPELLKVLNLEVLLDFLAEVSRDDIAQMLMDGTIKEETAIIHDNISLFVRRATFENKDFANWDWEKQYELLEEYADEVMQENKVKLEEEHQNAIEMAAAKKPAPGQTPPPAKE